MLSSIITNNMDIIMISEKKLDEYFPINPFLIKGYVNTIRFDRTCHGGSIVPFIKEDRLEN